MLRFTALLGACLVLWWACDDSASGFFPGEVDMSRPDATPDLGPDVGPDAEICPPGQIRDEAGCVPLPPDPCPLLDARYPDCLDRDGDCFPDTCVKPVEAAAIDCDDRRPEAFPGAPERCNGLDDDCDGLVDEGYPLASACDGCTGPGVVVCHLDDPFQTACSTDFGQPEVSAAPPICGVGEGACATFAGACRLDVSAGPRAALSACAEGLTFIDEAGVGFVDAEGERRVAEGPAAWPSCGDGAMAWLVPGEAPCVEAGVAHCPDAELWLRVGDGPAARIAGPGHFGPPALGAGRLVWHAVVDEAPVLMAATLPEGAPEVLFAGAPLSDPSPPVAGRVVVRTWEGVAPRVAIYAVEDRAVALRHPGEAMGRPALGDNHVAWIAGEPPAAWVAPLDDPRALTQITTARSVAGLWLDGSGLVWVDDLGLRRVDLVTGARQTVFEGVTPVHTVTVGADGVLRIDGDTIVLHGPVP